MSNTIPLPEPDITSTQIDSVMRTYTIRSYSADQMHAHAAAVSAERDARIKVLEDALRELVGACDDDSVIRFEDALIAVRAALGDK